MVDGWLLLLVFSAIAIGWYLGRRASAFQADLHTPSALQQQYYKGLNYLLNDQPDGALDAFIEALEVNSETLETHIAVGNLMRRKGEVERAIRIHQNLLSRPSLPREHLHQAHLELAKDFIAAGLLDRAERLLEELLVDAPELNKTVTRHLLEILQDEKEWLQAIEKAKQLLPKKSLLKSANPDHQVLRSLSHYYCELAVQVLSKNDFLAARKYLKQALHYDRNCVRASLLLGQVECDTGHYDQAIKALHKIRQQNLAYVSESIPLLKECCEKKGNREGYRQYLQSCLEMYPSVSIVLALAEDIQEHEGESATADFIGGELKRRPSLRGLDRLLTLHIANSSDKAKENLSLLQMLISQLIEGKPQYQCQHCGFSGKQLHWMCPTCKHWGEAAPIRGAEGD